MAQSETLLQTNLTALDKTFYVNEFLSSFSEHIGLYEFGEEQDSLVQIPGQEGTTANWARLHPFGLVTSKGSEAPTSITAVRIRGFTQTAQVDPWYQVVGISALTWSQGRKGTMPGTTQLLGQNAAESLEYGTASIIADTCIYPLPANAFSETTEAWNGSYYQERIAVTSTGTTTVIRSSNINVMHLAWSDNDGLIGSWVTVTKGAGYGYGGRVTDYQSDGSGSGVGELTVSPTMDEATGTYAGNLSYVTIAYPNPVATSSGVVLGAQHKLTTAILNKARSILVINKAPTFSDGLYRCLLDPDLEVQLMQDTKWAAVMQYQKAVKGERGEIGVWGGFKFLRSTMCPRFAATNATRNDFSYTAGAMRMTLCMGRGAFGKVTIGGDPAGGNQPQFITHPPGSSGVYDATNNRGTMAWKFWWKVRALNANWIVGAMTYLA